MLGFLPKFIRVPLAYLLFILNLVFWGMLLFYPVMLCKIIFAKSRLRHFFDDLLVKLGEQWVYGNNRISDWLTNIEWDVHWDESVAYSENESYLIASNHQSWVDIVVLQRLFTGKFPFLRFFIKKQLVWLPILGFAFWGLDFPRMQRFSREYLEKHPEMKGKDLEATKQACQHFKTKPVSIINFFEGTRFTQAKHEKQGSPFKHLLKPRAGGAAFTLNAMYGSVRKLIDVTIAYPTGKNTFSDLFANRIKNVIVRINMFEIPEEFLHGDYQNDPEFKAHFQKWTNELWVKKDDLLNNILKPE
ncbi:MAG: acyltransferase [Gammaproteobacteria bacterium]|nr:acyltransferase [Gammaproteobacteria bacterium]